MRRTASILALVAFATFGCGTVVNELDDAGAGGAAGGPSRGGAGGNAGPGGAGGAAGGPSRGGSGGNTGPGGQGGAAGGPSKGGSGGNAGIGGAAGGPSKGGSGGNAGAGGVAGTPSKGGSGGGGVCVYGGTSHPFGTSFPDLDGCNTCSCSSSGIACTARACLPDGGSDGATDGGAACSYGGMTYPLGSSFPSIDSCNTCMCTSVGVACTKKLCPLPVDGGSSCALSASYTYGMTGGFVAYQDQVVLGPTSYRYTRTPVRVTGEPSTCAPALPACDTADAIDLADIKLDLAHADVQTALQLKTPPLYGRDTRPNDGSVFQLTASTGGSFLVGSPCPDTASSCIGIPAGIAKLVADLRALDEQQLKDPACSAFRN